MTNSFEQLCINFTNEKLQQLFNEDTFKTEAAVYEQEGVHAPGVTFIDNQPVVDLIELKGGLFSILDDIVKTPGKVLLYFTFPLSLSFTQYLPYLLLPFSPSFSLSLSYLSYLRRLRLKMGSCPRRSTPSSPPRPSM